MILRSAPTAEARSPTSRGPTSPVTSRKSLVGPERCTASGQCRGLNSRCLYLLDDRLRHKPRVVMLPETKDCPAGIAKSSTGVRVTLDVSRDLLTPIHRVRPGCDEALRAPVPEASVDEHCNPASGKDDVGAAAKVRAVRRVINAIPQPRGMQETAEADFRLRVATTVGPHRTPSAVAARRGRDGAHPPVLDRRFLLT